MKLDVWNGCHNLQWCYLLKEEGNCMYCLSWSWHLVSRFITTCAISAYHHLSCEVESSSWRGVLKTILCYNVCQCLAAGRRFFVGIAVSWANKTDRHDIAKILLKVMLNLITLTLHRGVPPWLSLSPIMLQVWWWGSPVSAPIKMTAII